MISAAVSTMVSVEPELENVATSPAGCEAHPLKPEGSRGGTRGERLGIAGEPLAQSLTRTVVRPRF